MRAYTSRSISEPDPGEEPEPVRRRPLLPFFAMFNWRNNMEKAIEVMTHMLALVVSALGITTSRLEELYVEYIGTYDPVMSTTVSDALAERSRSGVDMPPTVYDISQSLAMWSERMCVFPGDFLRFIRAMYGPRT